MVQMFVLHGKLVTARRHDRGSCIRPGDGRCHFVTSVFSYFLLFTVGFTRPARKGCLTGGCASCLIIDLT